MPKSWGQKLKILYVLDILKKHSDEQNPLTATAICDLLARQGIEAERKSFGIVAWLFSFYCKGTY